MESKDPQELLQMEPGRQVVMNITRCDNISLVSAPAIRESFSNIGNGKQNFASADIIGGRRNQSLSYEEDSISDSRRRSQRNRYEASLSRDKDRMLLDRYCSDPTLGRHKEFLQRYWYDLSLGRHKRMFDLICSGRETNDVRYFSPPPTATASHPPHFDPCDEDSDLESDVEDSNGRRKKYVDVYLVEYQEYRRPKEYYTIVQGLNEEYRYGRILEDLRIEFYCDGYVTRDQEFGKLIKLFGDHAKDVSTFLVRTGLVKRKYIRIHRL